MSEPYIGEIKLFGGNFAIRSWAMCDGQLLPISQNSALFSILGTIYGGDGRTTFALPDMRGRAAIHAGNGPGLSDRRLGSKGGAETTTQNLTQLASHNHNASTTGTITVDAVPGTTPTAAGSYLANSTVNMYGTAAPAATLHADTFTGTTTVLNNGGQQPMNNMQPYLTVTFLIALQGVFPSRS